MQILTVLSKPVNQRMVLGTLDGVMCGMCCFLSKSLMNEEPRIFIDMSFKQRNQIVMYGVSDLFKIGKNVKPQVSTVGSNFISNNNTTTEVSSGNNRTEGGGNSSNSGILGRIFGRAPSMSRNSTNPNKPKTPNRNKPGTPNVRMGNANNTQSVAGSIQGSVSINNNNNNVSQRPPKRARNNPNRVVNQPPTKRVNTNRNKLIQNLKKKNLPNFVINGLVKSYDNKRKTANQVVREANNFGKTIAAGITTQRKKTLRAL
jgi:curved DNA-binding protein CbpA